jgi:dTDP-4-amino-4,6-dideoxygalactose transaminase
MQHLRSLTVHGKGKEKYDNIRLGRNSRLDTLQAAILLVKFKAFKEYELDDINRWAEEYSKRLKDTVKTPVVPDGTYSSWAQYTLLLESEAQRNGLQAHLKEKGIPQWSITRSRFTCKPLSDTALCPREAFRSRKMPANVC